MGEPLALELERLGYPSVIEPLLSIVPLAVPRPHKSFDAVILTSGSALSSLEKRRGEIPDLFALPCFCVGPRTAEKARQYGFRHTQAAESDGAELARLAGSTLTGKKASILHIAGRNLDGKAQQGLEKLGHSVTVWPVYEAVPIAALTVTTRGLLEQRQIDAIVIFSPRTAEALVERLASHALEACCPRLAAICLSEAVADVLRCLSWRQLATASVPSEKAVLTRLQEICPVQS
jgi:uroporphyrinogen-III synthase